MNVVSVTGVGAVCGGFFAISSLTFVRLELSRQAGRGRELGQLCGRIASLIQPITPPPLQAPFPFRNHFIARHVLYVVTCHLDVGPDFDKTLEIFSKNPKNPHHLGLFSERKSSCQVE